MRSADESSWKVVVKTGVLAVGSWKEPCSQCVPSLIVSFKQSEGRGRHKQWKTWCSAPHRRTAERDQRQFPLQTTLRPITMERSRRSDTAADWRLRATRWLAGCVSRLSCQLIVANIETSKLEHGNGTVEEPVGQPLMKWHRGKAGLGCSWIIRVLTGNRSGWRFGDVSCAVRNRDAGPHLSVCERMSRCEETHRLDHQPRSRTWAWDLDSCS